METKIIGWYLWRFWNILSYNFLESSAEFSAIIDKSEILVQLLFLVDLQEQNVLTRVNLRQYPWYICWHNSPIALEKVEVIKLPVVIFCLDHPTYPNAWNIFAISEGKEWQEIMWSLRNFLDNTPTRYDPIHLYYLQPGSVLHFVWSV